jgi:photosynthetic reaction center cytochrome c subunit
MTNRSGNFNVVSRRGAFLLIFGLVTIVLVGSSLGVVAWIFNQLNALVDPPRRSPSAAVYTNYDPGDSSEYLRPESLQAMTAYQQQFPEPQNVQILTGWNTAQISNYMVQQVSGGLRVDCTYCHVLTNGNFAEEGNPNKDTARTMMRMVAELNQEWVSQLQVSVGTKQVTCATCHNGQPVFETYPAAVQNTQPRDFVLPLDLEYPGGLAVTGQTDTKSLEDVALNQYTMYHMNVSLGVGCTFCHNARYFPSNEIAQKGHATLMLQMVQDINANAEYKEAMNNKVPSCYTCHQGAQLPPGSANSPQDVPPMLSTDGQLANWHQEQVGATVCVGCHPDTAELPLPAGANAPLPSALRPRD